MPRNLNSPHGGRNPERPSALRKLDKKPPTYEQKVKRIYPSARCNAEVPDVRYVVYSHGNTGKLLSQATSELEAWRNASFTVEPPKRATLDEIEQ